MLQRNPWHLNLYRSSCRSVKIFPDETICKATLCEFISVQLHRTYGTTFFWQQYGAESRKQKISICVQLHVKVFLLIRTYIKSNDLELNSIFYSVLRFCINHTFPTFAHDGTWRETDRILRSAVFRFLAFSPFELVFSSIYGTRVLFFC